MEITIETFALGIAIILFIVWLICVIVQTSKDEKHSRKLLEINEHKRKEILADLWNDAYNLGKKHGYRKGYTTGLSKAKDIIFHNVSSDDKENFEFTNKIYRLVNAIDDEITSFDLKWLSEENKKGYDD